MHVTRHSDCAWSLVTTRHAVVNLHSVHKFPPVLSLLGMMSSNCQANFGVEAGEFAG